MVLSQNVWNMLVPRRIRIRWKGDGVAREGFQSPVADVIGTMQRQVCRFSWQSPGWLLLCKGSDYILICRESQEAKGFSKAVECLLDEKHATGLMSPCANRLLGSCVSGIIMEVDGTFYFCKGIWPSKGIVHFHR